MSEDGRPKYEFVLSIADPEQGESLANSLE